MADSLKFTLGGQLGTSFKQTLSQAESQAHAAALRIQSSLRAKISGYDRQLAKADPYSAEGSALRMQKIRAENALLISTNAQFIAAARKRQEITERISKLGNGFTNPIFGDAQPSDATRNAVLKQALLMRKAIRDGQSKIPNLILGDAQPSDATRNAVLKQALLLRKAIRDGQSKIPNLIFQDTPEEAAKKLGQVGAMSGTSFMSNFLKKLNIPGGGAQQLVHVFRATFDSLASGMSPWRVMLQQAPQAMQAMATMGASFLGLMAKIFLPIAILTAGVAVGIYRIKRIIESGSGLHMPDMKTEFVARIDRVAESWRRVILAVKDAQTAYDGVAASAERAMEITKLDFELQRKKLELSGHGANSPAQLALNKEERARKISDLKTEQAALETQKKKYLDEAAGLKVPGPSDKEARTIADLKRAAEDPEALKQVEAARARKSQRSGEGFFKGPFVGKDLVNMSPAARLAQAMSSGVLSGTSAENDQQIIDDFARRQKAYQAAVSAVPGHDVARARADKLTELATGSGTKAVEIKGQIKQLEDELARQNQLERLGMLSEMTNRKSVALGTNSWSSIGGQTTGGPAVALLDVAKLQLKHLASIDTRLGQAGGNPADPWGGK